MGQWSGFAGFDWAWLNEVWGEHATGTFVFAMELSTIIEYFAFAGNAFMRYAQGIRSPGGMNVAKQP